MMCGRSMILHRLDIDMQQTCCTDYENASCMSDWCWVNLLGNLASMLMEKRGVLTIHTSNSLRSHIGTVVKWPSNIHVSTAIESYITVTKEEFSNFLNTKQYASIKKYILATKCPLSIHTAGSKVLASYKINKELRQNRVMKQYSLSQLVYNTFSPLQEIGPC